MYKILVDENIPFATEAFSGFGSVKTATGREITNSHLKDTDILIIRSVTKVDKSLLSGTPVKFVGTTTIGLDHIDTDYLTNKKIKFEHSPGCNANSVAEYVFTSLLKIASEKGFVLRGKSLGIIGYGNIGSKVVRIAQSFGMRTLINDPPLQRTTGQTFFVSYKEALQADIITFHVPLNMEGIDKTHHMLSDTQLQEFDDEKIILNTSRGSVISNNDLKKFLLKNKNIVILDVWENEPNIDLDLLHLTAIATPHIAGYSLEGKVNGTIMVYNALSKFLKLNPGWQPKIRTVEKPIFDYRQEGKLEEVLSNIITQIYDIENDDIKLRMISGIEKNEQSKYFDQLRKNYPIRRDFSNYSIKINKHLTRDIKIFEALRFKIIPI